MAKASDPRRTLNDGLPVGTARVFLIPDDVDASFVERVNRNFALFKAFSKSCSQLPSNAIPAKRNFPTVRRKNEKTSLVSKNIQVKHKRTTKKMELNQMELDFVKSTVGPKESLDSGIYSPPTRILRSSEIDENPTDLSQNPKGKRRQADEEKANGPCVAYHSQKKQGNAKNTGQTCSTNKQSKFPVLQKQSKAKESGFAEKKIAKRDRKDKRLDRLRSLVNHQDDGTWVQCCVKTCEKWRFLEEYDDPADVPKKWYCYMNNDADFASCDIPEEEIPNKVSDELIETKYCAGSVVWARLDGYPWFPSLIDCCPNKLVYYEQDGTSLVPIKYHVVFLNSTKVQRAWIRDKDLKTYANNSREIVVKKTKFRKTDFKIQLDEACTLADEALKLSCSERLERFGWNARVSTKASVESVNSRGKRQRCPAAKGNGKSGGVNAPTFKKVNAEKSKKDRDSVEKKYKVGDIVWSHPQGYPWWPAIIDNCPDLMKHYQFPESPRAPIEYHVTYFNEKEFEYDWRTEQHLNPFAQYPRDRLVKKTKYGKKDYKRELNVACALAREAQELSLNERLNRFGAIARLHQTYSKSTKIMKLSNSELSGQTQISSNQTTLSRVSEWDAIGLDENIMSILGFIDDDTVIRISSLLSLDSPKNPSNSVERIMSILDQKQNHSNHPPAEINGAKGSTSQISEPMDTNELSTADKIDRETYPSKVSYSLSSTISKPFSFDAMASTISDPASWFQHSGDFKVNFTNEDNDNDDVIENTESKKFERKHSIPKIISFSSDTWEIDDIDITNLLNSIDG